MSATGSSHSKMSEQRISALLTLGVVASLAGVLAHVGSNLLTVPFLVGPFLQSGLIIAAVWTACRLAIGIRASPWRWGGALALLFLGPATLEALWARLPYLVIQRWQLTIVVTVVIAMSSLWSVRMLAGRFLPLPAALLSIASVLYTLAVFSNPVFLSFWSMAAILIAGGWLWSLPGARGTNRNDLTGVIESVLVRHDPLGIVFEDLANSDEYRGEAAKIAQAVANCHGPDDLLNHIWSVFQDAFGAELAGERSRYQALVAELWAVLKGRPG